MRDENLHSPALVRYPAAYLREYATEIFIRSGMRDEDSALAADVLCTADEWGIRSHGLARLRSYIQMLSEGRVKLRANPRTVKSSASVSVVDGDNGLGLVIGSFANQLAIEQAVAGGSAWVSVVNSNHFGIAGYYAIQGVQNEQIGICMTNTPPVVAPYGGRERMLGTNPIAVAFPTATERPIVIDFATSMVSLGSVQNALRAGVQMSAACLTTVDGSPSTNPSDFFDGGALLPLGGDQGSSGHKGYCMSALVDLLCGPLAGAAWGPFVPSFLNQDQRISSDVGSGTGHLFGALSIAAFGEPWDVRQRMTQWSEVMRNTLPVHGGTGVIIPGDPEHDAKATSRDLGVAIETAVCNDLLLLGADLGVSFDL